MTKKLYYTTKEVSEILGIEQHTLRYWEKEFPHISPSRSDGNHRLYTTNEIEQIKVIIYLLKDKKMKIEGAKKLLKKNYDEVRRNQIVTNKLQNIKKELSLLRKEFELISKESKQTSTK